jgi:hypothetical protein
MQKKQIIMIAAMFFILFMAYGFEENVITLSQIKKAAALLLYSKGG